MRDALLVLEDGRRFHARRFGASGDTGGEVVFNTSMSGYQEILTDPSYAGQIVVFTAPQMGNYGLAREDDESRRIFLAGIVVKEVSRVASNWRSCETLDGGLTRHDIPGICDLDTRALVRHLRERGAMRGVIVSHDACDADIADRLAATPSMTGAALAPVVTADAPYRWTGKSLPWVRAGAWRETVNRPHVVVCDYGVKWSILRRLADLGCDVTVVPASTTAAEILALAPAGVVLSNGPGDPEPLVAQVATVRDLLGRVPVFGICLGHQLLGLAAGGRTFKLKFGHRGGNHPVMDMTTRAVGITAHNHGFAVDPDSLPSARAAVTHVNLYDGTCEGLTLRDVPAFGIQFHPEGGPGPHDAVALFDGFRSLMATPGSR